MEITEILNGSFNLGTFLSEIIATCFFTLLVFIFLKQKNRGGVFKITGIALGAIVSILSGWGVGTIVSGAGSGLSFISPILAIIASFHFQAFGALWFIILGQIVGTIIGYGIFWLASHFVYKEYLETKSQEKTIGTKDTFARSAIFQPILIIVMIAISAVDFSQYGTGLFLNSVILTIGILLLIFLNRHHGYLIFSPLLALVQMLDDFLSGQWKKQIFINFLIEFSIQAISLSILLTADVFLLENRRI